MTNDQNGGNNHNDVQKNHLVVDIRAKLDTHKMHEETLLDGEQKFDLICLSHLRWNFVFQRPQHLLSRCARERRVFFVEEPIRTTHPEPMLHVSHPNNEGVVVVVPYLPESLSPAECEAEQQRLLDEFIAENDINQYVLWYYTPMAMAFSAHLKPMAIVYDCMDQLAAFKGAPPELIEREIDLFKVADLVFTGGQSLYEAKRPHHPEVHAFPSSVDVAHFEQAKHVETEPADQAHIPHPRIGFFGVIDERLNIDLLREIAEKRPDWHYVIIGPVVKIDPATLPQLPNIHYLGGKDYKELPQYLSGWDMAMMPFAKNESTEFISPTKTPEFLAAGKRIVSTSIKDVVVPYEALRLVKIADTSEAFVAALDAMFEEVHTDLDWQQRADAFLSQNSWDKTWAGMRGNINRILNRKNIQDHKVVSRRERWQTKEGTFDYLIVGAGFAGSVLAERLASDGNKVLIVDRRPHIAGNAYDHYDDHGILVHKYGPHIFHTNSKEVFDYLSRFTEWRDYEHRVLAQVDGQLVPIPINRTTINKLYNLNLDEQGVADFLASKAEQIDVIKTSEDVVVSTVGRELYEMFFQGYTRKQWGMDPSELDKCVTARIPTRTNTDDRYFTDSYQAMPLHGFTRMFENMLSHPNIKIMLNTDYREILRIIPHRKIIYTGPVDEFFNYRYGKLPYRSLEFKHETLDKEVHQPVAVVNYPNDNDYTRVTEFKQLTGQKHEKTSIVYEYSRAEGDPYYPIPKPENADIYNQYKALADALPNVYFVGRLATYKYYNMDQVVAQALTLFKHIKGEKVASKPAATASATQAALAPSR